MKLGFHDFAGSCAIHMVGGIAALIGAAMLGPRLGKYVKDKDGKVTKVNAIPVTTLRSVRWAASSFGLAGMASTVRLPGMWSRLVRSS